MFETIEVIRRACPDFAIESIENLGEGDFCRAFHVNENIVFRFSKHEAARQSLMRESCLLPKIAGKISLKIPVPEISAFEAAPENSFIAYEFLPGEALTREAYLKLDEAERTRCAGQVARFLNELHSVEIGVAEMCGVEKVDYKEKYSALLTDVRENLRRRLEKEDFEFAENEVIKFLAAAETENFRPVLLHGDLSPDHVLFDGRKVNSIIDFGDVTIGDAARDFLWLFEDYGQDFFTRAVAQYAVDDKPQFIARVRRFSVIEGISWVSECLSGGEDDWSEAVENLRELRAGGNF